MKHFVFIEPERLLHTALESSYSLPMVALSFVVAILSAYTGFLISERVRAHDAGLAKQVWLFAGALALGLGIWAMHFIGMLALVLPMSVNYDVTITLFSMLPAFFASRVVLINDAIEKQSAIKCIARGVLMGAGIGLMHYMGMAAMHMDSLMRYDPAIFSLSIVVAITFSTVSLRLKSWSESGDLHRVTSRQAILIAAIVMGCAIAGMHYTGMAAVYYFPSPSLSDMPSQSDWDSRSLALLIGFDPVGGISIYQPPAVADEAITGE